MTPSFTEAMVPADHCQFALRFNGQPDTVGQVLSFSSSEHQLCEDYRLSIRLLATELLTPEQWLGKELCLVLLTGEGDQPISGILVQLVEHGHSHQGYHYTLTLASPWALLKQQRSNRVFTRMSLVEVTKKVLTGAGFSLDRLVMVTTEGMTQTLEMVVQYDESDYEFVTRLLRKQGYVYAFSETNAGPSLHICQESAELSKYFAPVELHYQASTGLVRLNHSIFSIKRETTLLANECYFDDHNDRSSMELALNSRKLSEIPGVGEDHRYGEHYHDLDEGQQLAQVRQQALDCCREQIVADTDCRSLRPGVTLTIHGHSDYGGRYLVLAVKHQGEQGGSVEYGSQGSAPGYKNQVRLLPIEQPYRAKIPANRRVFATFSATIEQEVDDEGRYRIKLPFAQESSGPASSPSRLIEPYGGGQHGLHFPLSKGTEVLVCGEHGDLDRPVILGALFNHHNPNPVTSHNPTENSLITRAGNQLLMDDKPGEEKIQLNTGDDHNRLVLDACKGQHQGALISQSGEIRVQAKYDLHVLAGGELFQRCGANMLIRAEQDLQYQTHLGDINFTAATDYLAMAGRDIGLQATQGNIDVDVAGALRLQSGEHSSMLVEQGDLEMLAPGGNIALEAGNYLVIKSKGEGAINICQGDTRIELDSQGNLLIDAKTITLSANNIVLKGQTISDN